MVHRDTDSKLCATLCKLVQKFHRITSFGCVSDDGRDVEIANVQESILIDSSIRNENETVNGGVATDFGLLRELHSRGSQLEGIPLTDLPVFCKEKLVGWLKPVRIKDFEDLKLITTVLRNCFIDAFNHATGERTSTSV